MIEYTIVEMGMRWELLDAMFVEDVPDGFEFGFVLRRSPDGGRRGGGGEVAPVVAGTRGEVAPEC